MTTLWVYGEGEPYAVALEQDEITIGRVQVNDICISDPTISKRHARLCKRDGSWWVEDLGSANGTWLGESQVSEPQQLAVGQTVSVGKHAIAIDETRIGAESKDEVAQGNTMYQSMRAIPLGTFEENVISNWEEENPAAAFESIGVPVENPALEEQSFQSIQLRLIREIGEALIDATEMSSAAQEILRIVVPELKADRAFICLFGDDDVSDRTLATHGVPSGEEIVFSKTVRQEMMANQSGVLIRPSAENDVPSLRNLQIKSTICAPLWTKDRIMGYVSMDSVDVTNCYEEQDLELLISVAHQAALGLERARLTGVASQERKRRDYLGQYLDHKLVTSVMDSTEGKDPLAPREQQVTILFCDIVSFTKLSEGLAPTELAAYIHEHLTAMTDILFENHGTVDKYIGDAIMALFGAPVADEKAPMNAVIAALRMRDYIESIQSPTTRMRFGIATGNAVVGNIGSSQRREYTALGDTVNVASRLETFARPNEIIIDDTTAEALRGKEQNQFELEQVGHIDVKNRIEPVNVYQVRTSWTKV